MRTKVLPRLGSTAVLVGMSLMVATPALAATGSITNVEASADQIRLVFEATETDAAVAAGTVTLEIDGAEIPATAEPITSDQAVGLARTTLLVMDTSGSMNQNGRLDGAKQAARAFVESVPDDVRVGLVTFDDGARVVSPPTADRAALADTIDSLTAQGATAIFDAVVLATRQLGSEGLRSIVLLTDGEEEGSRARLRDATGSLTSRKIRLDVVAFQSTAGRDTLERLAGAGDGQVRSSASSADLAAQFQAAAEQLSRQLLVTADVPADGPTGQVTLTVSGEVDGEVVTDSAIALLGSGPSETAVPSVDAAPPPSRLAAGPLMSPRLIWFAAGLFFLGLGGTLAFALNAAVPGGKRSVSRQLSVYTLSRGKTKERKSEGTSFGDSAIAQSAVELAARLTAKRGLEGRLQRKLDAGAVPLKPAEWILVQAGILLLLPLLAFVFSGRNLVITLIGLVVAAVGPSLFLSIKEARRRKRFSDSLPDVLQLMAGSLSAGYSLPQAVDSVVREGTDPVASEFNRALVEARLGVPIEDALETIAERMRSEDWRWVVMAIRVQREVGGNLAELLITVAATLRERARIRRQIQTLSAEGRLSAWILGALPIVFTLYLLATRPSYILTLTKEPLGWIMIASGVVAMAIGAVWMKKIVDVEI